MKKCAEKVYSVQVVKIQPEKKHSMDKLWWNESYKTDVSKRGLNLIAS